ncbi:FAD-dependent oxidoreductase [Streptomyces sp. NBC_01335]|uniref:FAD-dependent oxidoreductase n=1 Tax=Streptomyces sp. NBC_01335 TaxID=2903828 RepID=UPI002E110CFE|nr:FAD-dependent oxidoreductase [Streptomyces sp. NBC_01335]
MRTHADYDYDCDVLVIGGGIVGLSTAYALTRAAPGTRVTVLEEAHDPAEHLAGPGGGLIHSGVHHRRSSLTARFAARGGGEMTEFCARHGIAHTVAGKLIVATDRSELPRLHALAQRGREHGLPVRELGPAQIAEYEPGVRGQAAIRVSTTGVCDAAGVLAALAGEVVAAGSVVRCAARVTAVDRRPWGVAARTADGTVVRARALVNAAGPGSDRVARLAGDEPGVRVVPVRDTYVELRRPELVRGVVHPVPHPGHPFLGAQLVRGIVRSVDGTVHVGPVGATAPGRPVPPVHPGGLLSALTRPASWRTARRPEGYARDGARLVGAGAVLSAERTDVSGRTDRDGRPWQAGRSGRDVRDVRSDSTGAVVTAALRRLLPDVTEEDLGPARTTVRAQAVHGDGTPVEDFLIREAPHTVHVLHAPADAALATALPVGREIARRVLAPAQGAGWRPPAVESGHCV